MPQGRKDAFNFFCWVSPILSGVNGLSRLSLKDRDEENALYACQSVRDVCRRYGWRYVFVFKEGRSPSIFKEAQSIRDLSDGQWGKMVRGSRKKRECVVGGVRCAKDIPFGEHKTNVVEIHQMVASDDLGACYGQSMTDLEVNDVRRAFEIGAWGRHRWLIESSFKTEKREVAQGMWGRKICEVLNDYDYSTVELEAVYLNHEHEDACRSTS